MKTLLPTLLIVGILVVVGCSKPEGEAATPAATKTPAPQTKTKTEATPAAPTPGAAPTASPDQGGQSIKANEVGPL